MQIVNITHHILDFWRPDGTLFSVPPSGYTIDAGFTEVIEYRGAFMLIHSIPGPKPEGLLELELIEQQSPGALIVGSWLSAQAYPGRVVATFDAPGYGRRGRDDNRVARADKFKFVSKGDK